MAINPNEINIRNIIELIQSSSIKDNDLLVIGQGIYARKSTVLELYNKFGVPSILTSLNSLQFQINQLNNTLGNSVLYSPQVKTPQQKADARNNLDVYSRYETQTVVNSAIVNLGNVVNSVTSVNPALVDNSDPKNPVIAEFREISDYNNDMLNKADIDGNLTIGGIWWQDQVLSDRFSNYKQVWTALSNNTIEWGNIELDKHVFLVDDSNSLEIKTSTVVGTIWNTLNLTNVSQLNNDAGYLQANDLDGFIYDVQYNSASHTITFYQQNEPNIVIDLPIESLIKGVQLVGNDLIFTFEDGSTVTVPLNTLLVGVVKSVNGKTPNSNGEIILNVTDIPNLSSELANKLDIRMAGLVNNLTQPEKDVILGKLGVTSNVTQVLSLNSNTISLSGGGGSVSLGIDNIGGLQNALDVKVDNMQNANGLGFSSGDFNLAPYIYHSSGQLRFLATQEWANNTFATISNLNNKSNIDASNINVQNYQDKLNVVYGSNATATQNYTTDYSTVTNRSQFFRIQNVFTTGSLGFQVTNPNNPTLYAFQLQQRAFDGLGLQYRMKNTTWGSLIDIWDSNNFDPNTKTNVDGSNLTNISNWQSVLGINTSWNLQQVTNNGAGTTHTINVGGVITTSHGTSADWNAKVSQSQLTTALANAFEKESINTSLNVNSFDLGLFTVLPTTANLPFATYGVVYCYKANATWWFQQFKDTNGNIWERRAVNPSNVNDWQPWIKTNANSSIDNYALVSQIPTVNNGTFTVTGTGSLTGGGSTSANASANTTAPLDLTTAEKARIQQGVDAYTNASRLLDNVGFNSSAPLKPTSKKTVVDVNSSGITITLQSGLIDGDEICIRSNGLDYFVNGDINTISGSSSVGFTLNSTWWWSANTNKWFLV